MVNCMKTNTPILTSLPITVGIIGHRDGKFTEQHKTFFKEFFTFLREEYPYSPITLFSQLAEGADSEVAEVFLKFKHTYYTEHKVTDMLNLVVPLPFERPKFAETMTNKTASDKFKHLLSQATRQFPLSSTNGKNKEELYRDGGRFVADSSIILISLWDGVPNDKPAGTYNTINYIESQGSERANYIGDLSTTNHFSLHTPRKGTKDYSISKQSIDSFKDFLSKHPTLGLTLNKIEQINKHIERENKQFKNKADNSTSHLSTDNPINPYFQTVDILANKHVKNYRRLLLVLFILGGITIGLFEYFDKLSLYWPLMAMLSIGFILAFFKLNIIKTCHQLSLDYRVLAEALRIQGHWLENNIDLRAADHLLNIHTKEFTWCNKILLSIYGSTHKQYDVANMNNPQYSTLTDWIDDQLDFFKKRIKNLKPQKKHRNGSS